MQSVKCVIDLKCFDIIIAFFSNEKAIANDLLHFKLSEKAEGNQSIKAFNAKREFNLATSCYLNLHQCSYFSLHEQVCSLDWHYFE